MMLEDLGQYLEDAGVAVLGETLFLNTRPDSPDLCLTLYQYGGAQPEYVQDVAGPDVELPQLQVIARARTQAAAENLAYHAWQQLTLVRNQFLGSTYYRSVFPNGSPGLMGRDPNDRLLISFNCTVAKEAPVGASS